MKRIKNVGLVFCVFVVLLVIFSSFLRANELGALCGALSGTPVLIHVFNRIAPRRTSPEQGPTVRPESPPSTELPVQHSEQVFVLRLERPNGRR